MLFLLLLLAATIRSQQQQFQLADSRYPPDGCNGSANALGALTLANDVLGQFLQLRFELNSSFHSCYLCEQYRLAQYCANSSAGADSIYLTLDAQTNLQVLLLDAHSDQPVALRAFDLASDLGRNEFASNLTLPLADLGLAGRAHCGARLRLLVMALLTIDEPVSKDLVALAYTRGAAQAINCTDHALYQAANIDCRATPLLYPVWYEVRDCAPLRDETPLPPAVLRQWPPLYWYHALVMDNSSALPLALCGERLDTLLFRTRLYQQQCYAAVPSDPTAACEWWDRLLVRYLVLWLNGARANTSDNLLVHVSLEAMRAQLERTCTRRASCLVAELPDFGDYYTRADDAEVEAIEAVDNATLCAELRDYFEAHYRATERDFLALFEAWYRSTFNALIYPDSAFTTKTVLFVLTVFCAVLLAVFGVGIAGFQMRVKVRKITAVT
jgi:hypothetical protein